MVIETWFNQDLQQPVKVHYLDGSMFSHNGNGNRIGVHVFNNGEAVTLSGTVSGYVVTADGTTVPCTGTRSGNSASILIPAAAYQPGAVFITVFLTDGNTVTTLASVATNVLTARTGNQVSPGSVVTDWTNTINAAMQAVVDANAANMATPYESLTFPVPLGKYCIYNNILYRCKTPIPSSETFTPAHWTAAKLGDDVADLKSALYNVESGNSNCMKDAKFYDGYYNGSNVYQGTGTETIGAFWGVAVVPVPKGENVVISGFTAQGGVRSCWLNSNDPDDVNSFAWNSSNNNGTKYCVTGWLGIADYNYKGTQNNLYINNPIIEKITDNVKQNSKSIIEISEDVISFDEDLFVVGGIYNGTPKPEQTYRVTSDRIQTASYKMIVSADTGFRIIVSKYVNGSPSTSSEAVQSYTINSGEEYRITIQRFPLDTSETANKSTFVSKIHCQTELQNVVQSTLQPAFANFSTIGNANLLPANRTYVVYGTDVADGANLPEGLSTELAAYPATITTIQSGETRGSQFIISTNNVFFRTVTIAAGVVSNGTTWRTLNNSSQLDVTLKDFLGASYSSFSTIGNANALKANRAYTVYGSDVVDGANLPQELSKELAAWAATIVTIAATAGKGIQFIISTNNIFFRTVGLANLTVTNGTVWRTIDDRTYVETMINSIVSSLVSTPYSEYENAYNTVNGAYLKAALETDGIDCTPSNVYGTHESNIYIYNDKIYLVCSTNKTDATEDQEKYNLELICCSMNGTPQFNKKIVAIGDTLVGDVVQKCQASFILPVGGTIHIYCDVYISTGYKLYHVAYDIANDAFGSFSEVLFVNSAGTTVKAEKNGEQYICPSWFSYGNHDYCTALYFNRDNAGIGYTDDFTTFNFITRIDARRIGAGGEITAAYINTSNKFIVAYRTPTEDSFLNFVQYNITSGQWENAMRIPDATARPMFFTINNVTYLVNNAPYTRADVTVWKYLTIYNEGVWSNMGRLRPVEVAKLNTPCTYFSFCIYNGEIYMASIQSNLTKIVVSKIYAQYVTMDSIYSKIMELFDT